MNIDNDKFAERLALSIAEAGSQHNEFNFAVEQLRNIADVSQSDLDYIIYLINHERFCIDDIKSLDYAIGGSNWLDMLVFINVIKNLSRFGASFNVEMLSYSTSKLHKNKNEDFIAAVLVLIIDDNGYVRCIGRALWDTYNLHTCSVDIDNLSADSQIKFIISMLQDLGNPQKRLPKLLPLLDSREQIIPGFLIHQLLPYIQNYLGYVVKELDSLEIKNKEAVDHIKRQCEDFGDFINKRQQCKELNPEYTQHAIMMESAIAFQEELDEAFKLNEESSILKYFNKVELARGICSREEDGKERELFKMSTSVPKPIMSESMSVYEQVELGGKIYLDWSTINA